VALDAAGEQPLDIINLLAADVAQELLVTNEHKPGLQPAEEEVAAEEAQYGDTKEALEEYYKVGLAASRKVIEAMHIG
jgi:hypothetical protein